MALLPAGLFLVLPFVLLPHLLPAHQIGWNLLVDLERLGTLLIQNQKVQIVQDRRLLLPVPKSIDSNT